MPGQAAARTRCRHYMAETDEYVHGAAGEHQALLSAGSRSGAGEDGGGLASPSPSAKAAGAEALQSPAGSRKGGAPGDAHSVAYARMRALCVALGREIRSDIALHNEHIFPRYTLPPWGLVSAGKVLKGL